MNIFQSINNYFVNKRRDRLWGDLKVLEKRAKFEPQYSKVPKAFFASDTFTRKVTEYMIWYSGNEEALRDFFLNQGYISKDGTSQNLFWEVAPDNYPMKHSGFPALISAKMATILFGKGYDIDVEVPNAMGDNNEEQSAKIKDFLTDVLLEKINFNDSIMDAAAKESWGGHVFLKLSYDVSLSPYPILEVVDIRNAEEVSRRGITKAIVFHFWYTHKESANEKETQYRLDEIYRTADEFDLVASEQSPAMDGELGDAIIEYRLYKLDKDGKEIELPFNSIPETEDILAQKAIFKGLKGILAISKPNKKPNNDFIDSPYGASDYAHSRTAFDALDEVASELARETRDNKSIIKWPSTLLPKDEEGRAYLKKFRTNFIASEMDMREGAENKPEVFEFNDKTASLMEKYKQNVVLITNNAEISPLALGITGLESIASSDASQRERNKATIETRSKKLQLWKPAIEKGLMKAMELNTWIQNTFPETIPEGVEKMEVDFANCNIKINFPQYINDTETEITTNINAARSGQFMSIKQAVKKYHSMAMDGWSDADIDDEVKQILYEQGLGTDNPETMLLNDLTKKL